MEIGGSNFHFLDLSIAIAGNRLVTTVYSKPTDSHLYLNASHPKSHIVGIAKVVELKLRRICSDDGDFQDKTKEYCKYLIDCGHDREHVDKVFNEIGTMTRKKHAYLDEREQTLCLYQ